MKRGIIFGWGLALGWLGLVFAVQGQALAPSAGEAALDAAARQQKYLFVLFHKQDDAATLTMGLTLEAALAKRNGQGLVIRVCTTDPVEKPLIDRFGLSRSPMPLLLAFAPNGAITGAFAVKVTDGDIAKAFVSPGLAACFKGAQARKLVLVCVQPASRTELPLGVREFKADGTYGPATEVVTIRADDPAEAELLKQLRIQPGEATVTALLAPPGTLLGTFTGEVSKGQLVEKLQTAGGCCPGGKCGPGGCCPGGKCGPN